MHKSRVPFMTSCSARAWSRCFFIAAALYQSDDLTPVVMFVRSNLRLPETKETHTMLLIRSFNWISWSITCYRSERTHTWQLHTNHMEFEVIKRLTMFFFFVFFCLLCSLTVDSQGDGRSRIILNFLLGSAALTQTGNATDRKTGTHGPTRGCGQRQTSREIKRIIVNFLLRQEQVDEHWAARVLDIFSLLICLFIYLFSAGLITDLHHGAVGMLDDCWVFISGLLELWTSRTCIGASRFK